MNRTRQVRLWGIGLCLAIMATLAGGSTAALSAQTAEGTVITNTATATYTDANGNTYTAASGAVSVTVGFTGSLAVTSPAAASPSSPSTANTVTWTVANNGNGADQVQITTTSSDTNVPAISAVYNATPYASLALLNAALAQVGDSIAAATSITIDVVYDVAAGQGGNSSNVNLVATSTRLGGDTNNSTTVVTAVLSGSVSVTADNPTIDRLPSNGTVEYLATYTVGSGLTGVGDILLTASVEGVDGATIVITGIREVGNPTEIPPSTTISFTAGQSRAIEILYRVDGAVGDAGQTSTIRLTATGPVAAGAPTAFDEEVATIIAPSLTVVKTVHASAVDAQTNTASTLVGNPQPGTTIWYRVQVTNNGTASAVMSGGSNGISDDLSTLPVAYVAASLNGTGSSIAWTTLAEAADVITGTIAGGIPGGGATAWFVFSVTII